MYIGNQQYIGIVTPGNLSVGAPYWTSGGNFGIGTSSPARKLDVIGSIQLPSNNALYINGSSNYLYADSSATELASATKISLVTNGALRATLDSAGNLGLGVTPSAWQSVYKSFDFGNRGGLATEGSAVQLSLNGYYNAGWKYKQTAAASLYEQYNGTHTWFTAPSGTAGNAISFTQAMTLDASGNLGVGTTSPSQRLHINVGSATAIYNRIQNSAGDCYLGLDSSGNTILSADNAGNQLIFKTAAVERARIDGSGNFWLGGAFGTSVLSGAAFTNTTGATALYVGHANGTASGSVYEEFRYNTNTIGSITQNSTTGVLYNTSSDYRLKNITGPITGAEAKTFVMALQPKQGTWKADGSPFAGFVAHEFQEVSPSSVSGEKDAVDAEGKPVMQAMQASSPEVMANLVALIQEQQAIIEDMKTRLAAAGI